MKKIFTILILVFIISSCSRNEYEQKLIGNWNNYPNGGRSDIKFYNDSVITYEYYLKRKGTWKANKSEIQFHFPKRIDGYREYYTLDYKVLNDTLLIKNKNDKEFLIPGLFRVSDYWNHFLRELKMDIDLPKADFKLIKNDSMVFGIDLYVGFKDKKVIINNFRKELHLDSEIEGLVFSERAMRKENEEKYLYFNLIIDKKVNEKKVDSLKQILKRFPEMKIFRVYKNDTANYGKYDLKNTGEYWNWYGKYE